MATPSGSPTPAPAQPPGGTEPAMAEPGRGVRLDGPVLDLPSGPAGTMSTVGTSVVNSGVGDGEQLPMELVRQRIPMTFDPLGADATVAQSLLQSRGDAVSNLFTGMAQVHVDLGQLITELQRPSAPANLIAVLVQPDGSPAGPVQIQFDPAPFGIHAQVVSVTNDDDGGFTLPFPAGMMLPTDSVVHLTIHGGGGNNLTVSVPATQIAANGLAGTIRLDQFVVPLQVSILAALQNIVSPPGATAPPAPLTNQPQLPVVKIGDDDGCLLQYGANNSVDKFPYGVFYRLVEPRASVVSEVHPIQVKPGTFTYLPKYASAALQLANPADPSSKALPDVPPGDPDQGQVAYVDRVPVEQPISVDGFKDQMMGLLPNGTFTGDETRAMAGTLGIGYVLHMSQRWTFQGLALGDLVYSLPLAPGEQQQVAIFERVDTARVSESEYFTEEQAEHQVAMADTSTRATFDSAFRESILGRSSFQTESSSSSWGASIILVSGGGGSSSASGSSSQSLQGQRNTSQQAAQTTHSAAENQASARRSAARTGMRVATASESETLTTKVITNHNHTHAMTMQYWEVQRLYDVTTAIDGLTLTVLVPLQVVRFMPPGQAALLTDPAQVDSRTKVLTRYGSIVKHSDVLAQALPRRFRHGLTMLTQFAADPLAAVEPAGGVAEDVIDLSLSGSFLRNEDVWVTCVTNRGTRVGPVKLANNAPMPPADKFETREELVDWLVAQRYFGQTTLSGRIALPSTMNRSNVVGFEVTRSFQQLSYPLMSHELAELNQLKAAFAGSDWLTSAIQSITGKTTTRRETVFLSPADIERTVGGPRLGSFEAHIEELDASGNPTGGPKEQYASLPLSGTELPQQPFPIPARQLAPVLRYNEVLEIEKMATHVVRNTLEYSKAVWSSMSEHERAVLLEAYTIGVPPGGVPDATQMVPLLNCVENRVLGYFGNSMIMPFNIPQALAAREVEGQNLDPVKLHDSLLAYQTATFQPPHSTVALPTRGVLAEAVLGHCASAEKIDLRRFWNWQDSPADTAPAISPVTLPTGGESIAGHLAAPSNLTNLPSLINNVLTAPTPDTSLLSALSAAAASQKDFDSSLTGAKELAGLVTNAQNTANLARADALKTTKELNAQAMATVGNILGGIYGGNPTAGSTAAAAVAGKSDGTAPAPAGGTKSGDTKTGDTKTGDTKTGDTKGGGGPGPAPSPGGSSGGSGGSTGGGAGAPTPAPGPPA